MLLLVTFIIVYSIKKNNAFFHKECVRYSLTQAKTGYGIYRASDNSDALYVFPALLSFLSYCRDFRLAHRASPPTMQEPRQSSPKTAILL